MTKEKDEHSNHLVEVAAVAGGAAGVVPGTVVAGPTVGVAAAGVRCVLHAA
jgi:hypothetical protein